ncbi:hypothetical protein CN646_07575 [Bacillus wiedmannii]|uniref:hypothetical protein n=1 Tax=Bacillus wiedmannii TaxID=1890302 RepID=UPI000BF041F2|nr:hypothetical protein [Bacillus wiedmannii]PEI73448.1 hypothetical protein CN646_07575 [Bacillus wiedmannii]
MKENEKIAFFRGYLHAKAEEFAKEFGYTTKEATDLLLQEFINEQKTEQNNPFNRKRGYENGR